jgi:hypothetical protein
MRARALVGRMEPLSAADTRLAAVRAAESKARVAELFEPEAPCDGCPHDPLADLHVSPGGEFCVWPVFGLTAAHAAACEVAAPAAAAAVGAAGQQRARRMWRPGPTGSERPPAHMERACRR